MKVLFRFTNTLDTFIKFTIRIILERLSSVCVNFKDNLHLHPFLPLTNKNIIERGKSLLTEISSFQSLGDGVKQIRNMGKQIFH